MNPVRYANLQEYRRVRYAQRRTAPQIGQGLPLAWIHLINIFSKFAEILSFSPENKQTVGSKCYTIT